jgi:metal-responsive CopG/Arc/MetJ family transcriptional regulator
MVIQVTIPDSAIKELEKLSVKTGHSRSALVRAAVLAMLESKKAPIVKSSGVSRAK